MTYTDAWEGGNYKILFDVEFVGEGNPEHVVHRWNGTEPPTSLDIENLKSNPEVAVSGNWVLVIVAWTNPVWGENVQKLTYTTYGSPAAGTELYFIVFEKIDNAWVDSPLKTITVPEMIPGDATVIVQKIPLGDDQYKAQVHWEWPGGEPETLIPSSILVQYKYNTPEAGWSNATRNGTMFDVMPTENLPDHTDATQFAIRLLYKTADGWFVVEAFEN